MCSCFRAQAPELFTRVSVFFFVGVSFIVVLLVFALWMNRSFLSLLFFFISPLSVRLLCPFYMIFFFVSLICDPSVLDFSGLSVQNMSLGR